jgi:predicted membrane protein
LVEGLLPLSNEWNDSNCVVLGSIFILSKEVSMRNQAQLFFGGLIIVIGALALLSNLFNVDFGSFFLPAILIFIGVLIIFRPRSLSPDTAFKLRLLGDVIHRGDWVVASEEMWSFIGSLKMDMSQADIPPGETSFRIFSFLGDVRLTVPENVGVSVSSFSFITDARLFGERFGGFFTPVEWSTDGYDQAERKIRIERVAFLGNLRVRLADKS